MMIEQVREQELGRIPYPPQGYLVIRLVKEQVDLRVYQKHTEEGLLATLNGFSVPLSALSSLRTLLAQVQT